METKEPVSHVSSRSNGKPKPDQESAWLGLVERHVEALKFGSVVITVHENRVVQVETSIRVRFDKKS